MQRPGEMKEFTAEDDGDVNLLTSSNGVLALKKLVLKEGCPVMLIRNLSRTLVNGSTGQVVHLLDDGPVVHFQEADVTLKMSKFDFTGN